MAADSGDSSPPGPAERSARDAPRHGQSGENSAKESRWRRWRHTRPFWGALLVILGGTEILLSERAPLPLIIHIGFQGLAGYLIPIVIILVGLLLLFHPVQRTFYSLIAVLLALSTWITSNLGGFIIGMLLALVGGSLAFAWGQREQRGTGKHSRPQPRRESSAGLALIRPDPAGEEGQTKPRNRRRATGPGNASQTTRQGNASHLTGPRQPTASRAMAGPDGRGSRARAACGTAAILAIPLAPLALSLLASPASARPVAGSQPRSPSDAGPTARPVPAPSAPASPSPSPARPRRRRPVPEAGAPAAHVAVDKSSLVGSSAVLAGLSYDGVAEVPTRSGRTPMLKFSMSSLTLSGGIALTATQGGHSFTTRDSSLELSGHVELYTTKISGNLAGTWVTFSPGKPPTGLRPDVTLTKVVADQLFATAESVRAIGSRLSAG